MAITLDELLGMNTKTRNDETPLDRFPSFDDFSRNAKELFEGKPFTIFSTHKENLGMWE